MKKRCLSLLMLCFLFLSACAGEVQSGTASNQLVFYPAEVTSILTGTPPPEDFIPLTDAQIRGIFPYVEEELFADAHYVDDVFRGIMGGLADSGIWFSIGQGHSFDVHDYGFDLSNHQPSDMHGVEVTAIIVERLNVPPSLQVDFRIDNAVYRFRSPRGDVGEEMQAHMEQLVTQIISGGAVDFSLFTNENE